MFTQVFSGLAHIYLEAILLLGLLAVLIFKPERIRRPDHFWKGCLLFAVSVVVPALLSLYMGSVDSRGFPSGGSNWTRLLSPIAPVLFSASFLFIVFSLLPIAAGRRCWPFAKEAENETE